MQRVLFRSFRAGSPLHDYPGKAVQARLEGGHCGVGRQGLDRSRLRAEATERYLRLWPATGAAVDRRGHYGLSGRQLRNGQTKP